MGKRIIAIFFIFMLITVAWTVLGGSLSQRTGRLSSRLHSEVISLWGSPQTQVSPELEFQWRVRETQQVEEKDPETNKVKIVTKEKLVWQRKPVILDSSDVRVDLKLDQRKKGLLWYATYGITFAGDYAYTHEEEQAGRLVITYRFPTTQASYDDFRFALAGSLDPKLTPITDNGIKIIRQTIDVENGDRVPFSFSYASRGLDYWRYSFGDDVNRVKDFHLSMTTDFRGIDFPEGTMSPTSKEETDQGWRLVWNFENLISGFQIGMEMPQNINPGPLAAQISYFAPICLAFFFIWMFVITLLRRIDLHPMNYLFLGAAFFAFHLLFAYLVDHLDIKAAFIIASVVSIFLVVTYLRLVVGLRFAALEAGISQAIYLVFFSYAHFLQGYTGLIVTIGGILTLFAVMQLTGRIRWTDKFKRNPAATPAAPLYP